MIIGLALPGPEVDPPAPVDPSPLEVDWGHCTAITRGPDRLCEYAADDPVRLWIEHPRAAQARVWVDDQPVEPERYALPQEPHGQGLRVPVPPHALELRVEVPGPAGWRQWGLLLQDRAERSTQSREEHNRLAEALGAAFRSNDPVQIEAAAVRMADWLQREQSLGWAVMVHAATAFELRRLRKFGAAERMLSRLRPLASAFAPERRLLTIHQGLLRWSQGRLHEAAELLRDGARASLRVEDAMGIGESIPIYAEALAELGYYREARHWARRGLEHMRLDCNRASVLRTIGWTNLLLRAQGQPHDDPRPDLQEAIALVREQEACAYKEGGARISLAVLALQDGAPARAMEQLDAIDPATLSPSDRVLTADLRVRALLATGADAAALWDAWHALQRHAEALGGDDPRWRVLVRQGEILGREGRVEAAIEALEAAEERLDRLVRAQAVVGVGRSATAERYLEGTVALVSRLVEQGRVARALCVAREARARRRSATAGLDGLPAAQRAEVEQRLLRYREHKRHAELTLALVPQRPHDQETALRHEAARASAAADAIVDEVVERLLAVAGDPRCEDLSPPAPGELLVDLFPRSGDQSSDQAGDRSDDWLVFTHDRDHTGVHAVASHGEPAALGRRVLASLSEALDGATRVRVLAHREAQELDLHAAPWHGRPLLAARPVTYGVELPVRPGAAGSDPPRALLVADPTDTLVNARAEVEAVAERLQAAGWVTTTVGVGTGAEQEGLGEPDFSGHALFHYAAHTATDPADPSLWAPYPGGAAARLPFLQVGTTARLSVHDILAQRPAPPVAFLAGCRTGVVEIDEGTTSIALAFLLADGQQVVASRDPVRDDEVADIARRFYESFVGAAQRDAAVAMHRVQQQWLVEDRGLVPYRVWVR